MMSGVDHRIRQLLAAGAALNQQFQLRLLEEALNGAGRIAGVVPQPVLVAIGIEDDRALAVLGFQAVGIELGLLLPDPGVLRGALGFNQRQRLAVIAPQHVIDEALALVVGHAADFDFKILPGRVPSRLP